MTRNAFKFIILLAFMLSFSPFILLGIACALCYAAWRIGFTAAIDFLAD